LAAKFATVKSPKSAIQRARSASLSFFQRSASDFSAMNATSKVSWITGFKRSKRPWKPSVSASFRTSSSVALSVSTTCRGVRSAARPGHARDMRTPPATTHAPHLGMPTSSPARGRAPQRTATCRL